jgi:hypothetical protein
MTHKTSFAETKFKRSLKRRYLNEGVNVTDEDASDKSLLTEQEWRAMRKKKGLPWK